MADEGEQVTLILPNGEKQKFLIPSGLSDAEAKVYVLSRRPDLFQPAKGQPDTYVGPLSDGSYVQIPRDATPGELQQLKIKLAGMQGPSAPTFASAAAKAKQQSASQVRALMDAGGYPELANAKPSGMLPSRSRAGLPAGQEPNVEWTLGALPAIGGTIGGTVGGVPGATLGGSAGRSLENLIRTAATGQPTQNPVSDIAVQGILQGVLEGGGQVLTKAGQAIAPAVVKRFGGSVLKGTLEKTGKAIDRYLSQPEFSGVTVNIEGPVNAIMDREIAQSQKVGAESLADRLSDLKDAWNKNYNLSDPSPLEANQFRRDIADMTSFAGEANKATINKIQRQVVGAVGDEIAKAVPGIQPLNDAYANVIAARTAIKQTAKKVTSGYTGTALAASSAALKGAGAAFPAAARTAGSMAPQSVDDLLANIRSLVAGQ